MNDNVDVARRSGSPASRESVEAELLRRNQELTELNEKLSRAQAQLLHHGIGSTRNIADNEVEYKVQS